MVHLPPHPLPSPQSSAAALPRAGPALHLGPRHRLTDAAGPSQSRTDAPAWAGRTGRRKRGQGYPRGKLGCQLSDRRHRPEELPAEEASALSGMGLLADAPEAGLCLVCVEEGKDGSVVSQQACGTAATLAIHHAEFHCACAGGSCLLHLTGEQLKQAYAETHPQGSKTSPRIVNAKLHALLWAMKGPLRGGKSTNGRGHTYSVPSFSYDRVSLCRRGWAVLMGGSAWGTREALGLVLRGISPHYVESERGAALLLATQTSVEKEATEKQQLTVNWLHHNYLNTMEYMPNDNCIVLRGMGCVLVHREQYTIASRIGGFYLSYKQWMACMHAAAVACVEADHGVSETSSKVRAHND